MQRILIIHPLKHWQLYGASVHLAAMDDELIVVRGRLTKSDLAEDDTATANLLRVCESLSEDRLYENVGIRKFRKQQAFWDEADDDLKSYTVKIAGQRFCDAIRRATELGLIIIFRAKTTDDLYIHKSLELKDSEVRPMMYFSKSAEGIDYRLQLSVEGELVVPSRTKIQIFAISPGLICMGRSMYLLPRDFNAKVIIPFINKESVFIPARMQNEYFRKFILKNVSKTEVAANGFDIMEKDVERSCLVCLERGFDEKAVITLRYRYGNSVYELEDSRKAAVNIIEEGEEIKLVKVTRSNEWERCCLKEIQNIGNREFLHGHCIFPDMEKAVAWLADIREQLLDNGSFDIQQNVSTSFYIHSYNIQKSKTWNGDWLHIRIAMVLSDGTSLPFSYFRENIISGEKEIELPNGDIFIIPDEWFAEYAGLLMIAAVSGDYFRVHKSQLSALDVAVMGAEEEEDASLMAGTQLTVPNTLNATLRSYQEEGVRWLIHNYDSRTGCCLSDDMGLGKTIQTIALILRNKELMREKEQKEKELASKKSAKRKAKAKAYGMADMFAGFFDGEQQKGSALPTLIVCPSSIVFNWYNELRRFAPQLQVCSYVGNVMERKRKLEGLGLWDVILTTYRTATNDMDSLCSLGFNMVIFDESQVFKNRNSQVYGAMLRLKAEHRVALSGTPMENSLPELWSLMNILNPLLLGDYKAFQRNFISPINENLADIRTNILRRTIAPYFLRRTKEQVLPDLPERQDEIVFCEMSEEQSHLYEEELSKARNLATDSSNNDLIVLSAINRLRQIACCPMLMKDEDSRDEGKLTSVFSRLEELRGTDHKVLLFSEYVTFLDLIVAEMTKRGWQFEMLTGDTRDREQVINRFTNSPTTQFFLVSLKAGGVGLNLTCADYVFVLDPWWNKAAEEQAISRAHRIGQKRSVFVYRFITKDTLEEQILELQERKTTLIETVMPFLKSAPHHPNFDVQSKQRHNNQI